MNSSAIWPIGVLRVPGRYASVRAADCKRRDPPSITPAVWEPVAPLCTAVAPASTLLPTFTDAAVAP
ncbi:MAG TPA: hypothetical protein PKD55_06160, partial [Bellilinea sp.]|nr:hypothetical protein [Bellilinea sp.]